MGLVGVSGIFFHGLVCLWVWVVFVLGVLHYSFGLRFVEIGRGEWRGSYFVGRRWPYQLRLRFFFFLS